MRKKIFHLAATSVIIATIFPACVDLKQVNDYSSQSLTGIRKFEDINYSFTQHCLDRCEFEAIKNFEIKREAACSCNIYQAADSVTLLIYHSIKSYFDGLTNLSDNELTAYNFDALKKALTAGDFGSIKIEEADVKACSAIASILLRSMTDLYRKRKIKEYIGQANQPLQVLLQKFQFILQKNLEDELNFKKEKLYTYYKEKSLSGDIPGYEKEKATIDYYAQLSTISRQQKQIDAFAKGLSHIAGGHQQLYDNRDKLTTKELKALIRQYAGDIRDIIAEFNKLKN